MFLKLRLDHGQKDLLTAIAHNETGIAQVMTRDYGPACEHFETAIQIYQGHDQYWRCMESLPIANWGQTLWAMGDHTAALTKLDEGLAMRIEVYGEGDRDSFR